MKVQVYYLSTCDTCKRILKSLTLPDGAVLQDIKKKHISSKELSELRKHVESYRDLLNNRAQKLKSENYNIEEMSESQIAQLILSHYSFLKRPVFIINDKAFIGNAKKTVEELSAHLS